MTALTFTDTLSRVMTSCGGTSMTIVRRLTRTMRSIGHATNVNPGPFGWSISLPSLKTTARSYSFRILIDANSQIATSTRGIRTGGNITESSRYAGIRVRVSGVTV